MYAGAVAYVKTYVINVAVIIIVMSENITYLNAVRRYSSTES